MIVIADTGPLNYLLLIGHIELLPVLFERVVIPDAVHMELQHSKAPELVRSWITSPPAWLEVRSVGQAYDIAMPHLDEGEREAILLARELGIAILLMDDLEGRSAARSQHLQVIGTLGVLQRASEKALINFKDALEKLDNTGFYISASLKYFLLEQQKKQ
jgi:predicted nucleic acid-binding protein